MHVAVSEFARHVVGLDGANSTEMDPETPYPVIDLLPEQKGVEDLGGTMRLGAQAVEVAEGTRARELYGEAVIFERHRHRYEVNNLYREQLDRRRPRRLRDVRAGPARRDRRAARPSVVRREPVPPGVQVAADAARRRSSGASSPRRSTARALARRRRSRRRSSSSATKPTETKKVQAGDAWSSSRGRGTRRSSRPCGSGSPCRGGSRAPASRRTRVGASGSRATSATRSASSSSRV